MKSESVIRLSAGQSPALSKYLGLEAPSDLHAWGNLSFLHNRMVAFFCSQRCPGSVLAKIYDLAQILSQRPITLVGGFQSPVEQEFLNRFLKSAMSAIVCPAKHLHGMRLKPEWQEPMLQGRLLLLSPFGDSVRRTTRAIAQQRNRFVAALADESLIAFASPDGAIQEVCHEMRSWKKRMYTVQDPANEHLLRLGAKSILPAEAFKIF